MQLIRVLPQSIYKCLCQLPHLPNHCYLIPFLFDDISTSPRIPENIYKKIGEQSTVGICYLLLGFFYGFLLGIVGFLLLMGWCLFILSLLCYLQLHLVLKWKEKRERRKEGIDRSEWNSILCIQFLMQFLNDRLQHPLFFIILSSIFHLI